MHNNPGLPRLLEISLVTAGLLILLPLLLSVFVLVRLTSPGAAFFRHKRIGLDGREFTLYKFRTLRVNNLGPLVTASNDSRITPIGRFLRKAKIDELPQLWNIFIGDMSLVGPRPEVPDYVNLSDPLWMEVLRVKPGITDPVTLKLRNEEVLMASVETNRETFYKECLQPYKLRGSIEYLKIRTWKSDIYVILQTILAVLPLKSFLVGNSEEFDKDVILLNSSNF